MSDHVHVRLRRGLGISDEGELTEHLECRCGERWTKAHPADRESQEE